MSHRVRERAIIRLVGGGLEGKARRELEEHLGSCAECRAFHAAALASQEVLERLGREELPPLDWAAIDAGLAEKLEQQGRARRPLAPTVLAVAGAAAAAFLVTMALTGRAPEPPRDEVAPAVAEHVPPVDVAAPDEVPPPLEAFVTFVAGEARSSAGDATWRPLRLDTPISEGLRLQTTDRGTVGVQLGRSGCRLEPGSEVELVDLDGGQARVELRGGRISCSGGDDGQVIVVSTIEVVASAAGSTRYAVDRREPEVVVVELAEGTLRVVHPGVDGDLDGPARLRLSADEGGGAEQSALDAEATGAVSSPALGLLPRRSIASLYIPAIDGVERAMVDGVEYGPLPLSLMRRPGAARVELFPVGGGDPFSTTVEVMLGQADIEPTDVVAALRQRPLERSIAPRIGTMDETQVRRLRGIVSSKVRTCYERVLKRDPSVWGRIAVRFNVSPTGEARRVQVSTLAGGHPSVNSCVESALHSERYPPPRGGFVPVEQTITLSPRF